MTWEQIDRAWIWVPAPGSKTKRNNAMALSKLMQRVLGPRRDSGRVMQIGDGSVRRLQKTIRKQLGLSEFVLHACRHICETKLGELRVPPHIRDVLLDHAIARSRSGAGYDHHDYETEMREAMEAWADYVEALVQPGENVAVLR
jgi:integrase